MKVFVFVYVCVSARPHGELARLIKREKNKTEHFFSLFKTCEISIVSLSHRVKLSSWPTTLPANVDDEQHLCVSVWRQTTKWTKQKKKRNHENWKRRTEKLPEKWLRDTHNFTMKTSDGREKKCSERHPTKHSTHNAICLILELQASIDSLLSRAQCFHFTSCERRKMLEKRWTMAQWRTWSEDLKKWRGKFAAQIEFSGVFFLSKVCFAQSSCLGISLWLSKLSPHYTHSNIIAHTWLEPFFPSFSHKFFLLVPYACRLCVDDNLINPSKVNTQHAFDYLLPPSFLRLFFPSSLSLYALAVPTVVCCRHRRVSPPPSSFC